MDINFIDSGHVPRFQDNHVLPPLVIEWSAFIALAFFSPNIQGA
jgi:hypothetical protein